MTGERERSWLARAIELAKRGTRATAPNPRVGCVVAQGGTIVGEGWHQRAGEAHAEVRALAEAGDAARGATLAVSLEPCAHAGRTPPCTEAIAAAGVSRVLVGLVDPDPKVSGRGIAALRDAGIAVELADGTERAAAARLLEEYVVHRRQGRAFVLAKVAATFDGRIADRDGESRWITGEPARAHGRALRDRYGAILVGANTVIADDPLLQPPTLAGGGAFHRVVLDGALRIPPECRLLREGSWSPTLVVHRDDAESARASALASAGAELLALPAGLSNDAFLRALLEELARRGVLGVIVEGGGRTHGAFLDAGLVDKIHWYLAPRALVDAGARPALAGASRSLPDAWAGSIAESEPLGDDVLLTLYPCRES